MAPVVVQLRPSSEHIPIVRAPGARDHAGVVPAHPNWPLLPPPCYDAISMNTRSDSGKTNLAAIAVLVGVVIAGVWVWKRLSLDTQEYVIDQAVTMAFGDRGGAVDVGPGVQPPQGATA